MLRSIHIKMFAAFIIVLFLVFPCYGEEKVISDEQLVYPEFKEIEFFGALVVNFGGENEEKLGLNQKQLKDYLKLKYKNNFASFPYKTAPEAYLYDDTKRKKVGIIEIYIWTVGSDYPVAYYIRLRAGHFSDVDIIELPALGFNSKDGINSAVKKYISELVEDFAIFFFKARGEM